MKESTLIRYPKAVLPEGAKLWGVGAVVIGGDNLPSPVVIGLTDLSNVGGGQ